MNVAVMHEPQMGSSSKVAGIMFGRFMLPDTTEHACQVSDITDRGAKFTCATVPPMGTAIVAYVEDLGRVEVVASNSFDGGFYVDYALSGPRLERLHQRIQWLRQKVAGGTADGRRHSRYEPQDKHSQITLPDGRVYPVEVIDISISGAAIKTEVMPSIGTYLSLGRQRGRVVRYMNEGVGIQFINQLAPSALPPVAGPTPL